MRIIIEADTVEGVSAHDRAILLALAGVHGHNEEPVAVAAEVQWQNPEPRTEAGAAEAAADLGQAPVTYYPGDSVSPDQHEPGPPPQGDVAEEANTRTPDDGQPRHPDGRIVGQAPEGKKRRTKAQIAEDEAWEAAQNAQQPAELGEGEPDDEPEPEPEEAAVIPPTQEQPFQAPPQPPVAPQAPPAPAPSSPFNF